MLKYSLFETNLRKGCREIKNTFYLVYNCLKIMPFTNKLQEGKIGKAKHMMI